MPASLMPLRPLVPSPMSPQSPPPAQIQVFLLQPPPNPVSKPPLRPVTTLPQQLPLALRLLPPPSEQQAPNPASLLWPPALLPATRKRPARKVVTMLPFPRIWNVRRLHTTIKPVIKIVKKLNTSPLMARFAMQIAPNATLEVLQRIR